MCRDHFIRHIKIRLMDMCEVEGVTVEEEFRSTCRFFKTLTGPLASITRMITTTLLSVFPNQNCQQDITGI